MVQNIKNLFALYQRYQQFYFSYYANKNILKKVLLLLFKFLWYMKLTNHKIPYLLFKSGNFYVNAY